MPNSVALKQDRRQILAPPRNCWRLSRAGRAALLTNADYFRRLADCMRRARHRILLIGWDLDAALVLDPHGSGPGALPLTQFLAALLDLRPGLEIRFLLWDRTVFYGGNRRSSAALHALSKRYPAFRYHFTPAPLACSHHAKLVAIDDGLAFVGGIDLAGDRWDRIDHPPSHPARTTPDGDAYGPTHDLQMLVAGPAAADLSAYAAQRWSEATGDPAPPAEPGPADWPDDLAPDFTDIPAGIARTLPQAAIREVETLNHDALAAARHCIYLEAQYLTASSIGDSLVRQLERPDGPEIVIVVTRTSHGMLEQFAMDNNRDRLLRRLAAADRWGRLRVYYPIVEDGDRRVEVKIHAKLVVIDDRLLRVGSSNLNNRSMAVDSECDLALEAAGEAHRERIRALRNRLIAEQLHQPAATVAAAFRRMTSVISVIEMLNGAGYLQPLEISPDGPDTPMPGTAVLDPNEPPTLGHLWCEVVPGGAHALLHFGAGEQQAAEGERE
ncbi:MAG: phospholipase D/Transphosphatidylase [Rhodospirillales bacterium]|nr:phospholipase D/Transphosphatidylase [Rhodospirillales bacterium]